jgi:hypothetical protein
MTNFDELLTKATKDKLSQSEIEFVASELAKRRNTSANTYILLHILGRAEAVKYENLVAQFLDSPSDPMLARIALIDLCDYWDLTPKYIDALRAFAKGVEWDSDDDVKLVALSTAGEYLNAKDDKELLLALKNAFLDPENDEIVRNAAFVAMARALGRKYSEVPSVTQLMEIPFYDQNIIREFDGRIRGESI